MFRGSLRADGWRRPKSPGPTHSYYRILVFFLIYQNLGQHHCLVPRRTWSRKNLFFFFFKYNTDFKKLIIIKNKTRCPSTYDKNVSDTRPPNVIVKTRAQDCIGTYLILSKEPDFPKPFVENTQATVLESHALTVLSSGLINL